MKKTGEQIVFEQKVFRGNEALICKMNDVILWHTSPIECRCFPKSALTNKCTYRKHACLFQYDEKRKILYKKVKNSDGIGM